MEMIIEKKGETVGFEGNAAPYRSERVITTTTAAITTAQSWRKWNKFCFHHHFQITNHICIQKNNIKSKIKQRC